LRFRLTGIFHSGFYQYDSALGFLRLTDAQRLFSEPDLLSVISFKVDDLNRAPEIAKEIEKAAGPGFMTTNWMEQNRELFRALKLEQYVTFIVIALIVIVAALNILIALTMMVMEKTRDIAVLMSMGAPAFACRGSSRPVGTNFREISATLAPAVPRRSDRLREYCPAIPDLRRSIRAARVPLNDSAFLGLSMHSHPQVLQ